MKKFMKAAQVNMQKTKYMEVTKGPTNTKMIKIDYQECERVKEFKYLGTDLQKIMVLIQK
jgi:hypothetical protein